MAGEPDERRHRSLPEPRHAPRVAQPQRSLAKPGTADGTGRVDDEQLTTCTGTIIAVHLDDHAARDGGPAVLMPGLDHLHAVPGLTGADPDTIRRYLRARILTLPTRPARARHAGTRP